MVDQIEAPVKATGRSEICLSIVTKISRTRKKRRLCRRFQTFNLTVPVTRKLVNAPRFVRHASRVELHTFNVEKCALIELDSYL